MGALEVEVKFVALSSRRAANTAEIWGSGSGNHRLSNIMNTNELPSPSCYTLVLSRSQRFRSNFFVWREGRQFVLFFDTFHRSALVHPFTDSLTETVRLLPCYLRIDDGQSLDDLGRLMSHFWRLRGVVSVWIRCRCIEVAYSTQVLERLTNHDWSNTIYST